MDLVDLFYHTIKAVNNRFGVVPVKGEIKYSNGVFILNFEINGNTVQIVTDRGFIEIYYLVDKQTKGLIVEYPQIANKWSTPENIDFIVDFLFNHKDEIFRE